MDVDRLHTRFEIATELGTVTANALLEAAQRGELAYYPVGRRHLFTLRDVTTWLDGKKVRPTVKLGPIPARATPRSAARRSRAS